MSASTSIHSEFDSMHKWNMAGYLLITIAYIVSGKLGLMLALPPGYASPIFPAAGIAVAVVLIGGNRTLPWIFLGALLLNIWVGYSNNPQISTLSLAVAMSIATASMLQAAIGGRILRQLIGYPATLDHKSKVLRFLLLAPLICLTSASFSVSSLLALDIIEGSRYFSNWSAWWLGDTLGLVVILPLIMTVAAEKHAIWKNRLRTVAIPILLVLLTGFAAIYFLQQTAFNSECLKQQENFDSQTREIALRIEQRMATYEQVLRGAKGLYVASKSVERKEFQQYVQELDLENHYPGIQVIGYSLIIPPQQKIRHIENLRKEGFQDYQVWPESQRDLYTSVVYLEPFTKRNQRAFGYDMYSEKVQRTAMEQARDQNRPAISGKVRLIQEAAQEEPYGFLIYLPIYRKDSPVETIAQRRANIIGWVYASFQMNDLMQGILGAQVKNIDLEIFDGSQALPATLMYDSQSSQSHFNPSLYNSEHQIKILGHNWLFRLHSLPVFEADTRTGHITQIRLSGISITLLLSLLVWLLASGRTRALNLAQGMTRDLRESEQQLKEAQRIAEVGSWKLDIPNDRLIWSDETYRIFEIAPAEFGATYDAFLNTIHPEDRPLVDKAYTASVKNRIPYSIEHRLLFADGRIKFVHERGETFYDTDGSALRSTGTVQDITERKHAEEALQQSSAHIEMLLNSVAEGIYGVDMQGNCTFINAAGLHLLGYQNESELLGKNMHGMIHHTRPDGSHYPVNECRLYQSMQSHENVHVSDELFWRKDKSSFQVDYWSRPTRLNGKDGAVITFMDIAERKLAEESLRKLSLAVEQSPNSIVITDLQGNIEFVNDAFINIAGYSAEEVIGKNPRILHSGNTPPSNYQALWANLMRGEKWAGEFYNRRKDGTDYIEMARISPVRQADGRITHYLAVKEDITERKRTEKFEKFRSHTLELLTGDTVLSDILDAIVQGVEQINPMMLCSIQLLDEEGKHLLQGAAPSLPDFYNAAIDGIKIGPGVGSCGTAAATAKRVIVEDIMTHPYWSPYSELAAKAGLRACWSEPIRSTSGQVLGTFSIYHQKAAAPVETDIAIIEQSAHLSSIAIERKRMEEQVRILAFYDSLTKLPNRRLMNDRLNQAMSHSKRTGLYAALMVLDLDNFKPLNDTYGHGVGDLLLIEVANRLKSCVREVDTVARFGGDEFVVILSGLNTSPGESTTQAANIAEKIRCSLALPYLLTTLNEQGIASNVEHRCTSSIGIRLFINHETNADDLFKQADLAMYAAKESGRNSIRFYVENPN